MSGTRDFTLDKYEELCVALLESGYSPITVCSYILEQEHNGKVCILRHDVDRMPKNVLKMAELEKAVGVVSTYYFRYPYTFEPDLIRRIAGLEHEIGYHYETLAKTNGDHEKAIRLFERELAEFREICDVRTICMHGSPLSRYDNRDLWRVYDFQKFGIVGEAYLSMAGNGLRYLTDTGRNWGGRHSLRDIMPGAEPVPVETTDDLIQWIRSAEAELYMTVHPERWAASKWEWALSYTKDIVMNAGKMVLMFR